MEYPQTEEGAGALSPKNVVKLDALNMFWGYFVDLKILKI